jgi:Lar family restriction alleviation protein
MTEATELKPCPFCGLGPSGNFDAEQVQFYRALGALNGYVWCEGCGAEGPERKDQSGAITAWNTRQASVPVQGEPVAYLYEKNGGRVLHFTRTPEFVTKMGHTETPLYTHAPTERERVLLEALAWYGEQARLCRLIHSEGDSGRHALSDDGGKRALAAIAQAQEPE